MNRNSANKAICLDIRSLKNKGEKKSKTTGHLNKVQRKYVCSTVSSDEKSVVYLTRGT